MSIVGPRPIVEPEIVRYGHHIRYYYHCRPGDHRSMAGKWAQWCLLQAPCCFRHSLRTKIRLYRPRHKGYCDDHSRCTSRSGSPL